MCVCLSLSLCMKSYLGETDSPREVGTFGILREMTKEMHHLRMCQLQASPILRLCPCPTCMS